MNSAYKKECWLTLISFLVVALLTHVFPFYFLFPGITEGTIFGFPTHYFLTIVIGWLVLIPLYWWYIPVSEAIDREIENSAPAEGVDRDESGLRRQATQPAGGGE